MVLSHDHIAEAYFILADVLPISSPSPKDDPWIGTLFLSQMGSPEIALVAIDENVRLSCCVSLVLDVQTFAS